MTVKITRISHFPHKNLVVRSFLEHFLELIELCPRFGPTPTFPIARGGRSLAQFRQPGGTRPWSIPGFEMGRHFR